MRFERVGGAALGLAAVLGMVLFGVAIWRTSYGLDRTDEGMYLLQAAHPQDDPATVLLFGYLLHPLHALGTGNIFGFRQFGLVTTFMLSASLMGHVARVGGAGRVAQVAARFAGGGGAALSVAWFPQTPSYNTVALWGCLVVGIGLAGALADPGDASTRTRRRPRRPAWATGPHWTTGCWWALIGLGIVLAGIGKPTSAIATLVVVLVVVLAVGRRAQSVAPAGLGLLAGLALGALAFLLLCLAVAGRAPVQLLQTVRAGVESVRLLGGHDRLLRLDPLDPAAWPAVVGVGPGTAAVLQVMLLVPLATLIVLTVRVARTRAATARGASGRGPMLSVADTSSSDDAHRARRPAPPVPVVLALLVLPACYALGTNTNLWQQMGRAGSLWLAALVLVCATVPHSVRVDSRRARASWVARIGLTVLAVTVLVGAVTMTGRDSYYRYPPPTQDTVSARVNPSMYQLRLTPQDARDSSAIVAAAPYVAGRDILDVTGASPGYIYQLGGRALGSSWLIGGYPGSEQAAAHAMSLVECHRIGTALVLDSPDSPRAIPGLLPALGLNPERDYRPILQFRHNLGWHVRLLEPLPSAADALRCPGN
ncbi:hypothetical protein BJY21_001635 [Kineosphaera limosa]|uniref:Glycosyltransferase RgtA/B/C/D-like domain-containing protein n=1 Tax=Kineosphaera limosa NBRC 100340 TaxID=1184609 RepID=K6WZM6_9MICO|nr:hypothetical protein [Kineosphaera limosa]NYE00451.1 hypothetical protein [Kineosphaera limosa]GAB97572.1 hypothetical protein KILIM_074_00210 [Kineosphaera limosa NBRC 100340]